MCPEWFLLPVEEAHLIVNESHLEKFSDKSHRALALIKWRARQVTKFCKQVLKYLLEDHNVA